MILHGAYHLFDQQRDSSFPPVFVLSLIYIVLFLVVYGLQPKSTHVSHWPIRLYGPHYPHPCCMVCTYIPSSIARTVSSIGYPQSPSTSSSPQPHPYAHHRHRPYPFPHLRRKSRKVQSQMAIFTAVLLFWFFASWCSFRQFRSSLRIAFQYSLNGINLVWWKNFWKFGKSY